VYRQVRSRPLSQEFRERLEQGYWVRALPETREEFHRDLRINIANYQIDQLANRMKALDRWRDMAESDLQHYQRALDAFCTAVRSIINSYSGRVAYHPEEEEERDAFILGYRWEHPSWTYETVARKYNENYKPPDKKALTRNSVRQICSRQALAETVRLIRMVRHTTNNDAFKKAMDLTWWPPKAPV
jgi:hypothetical protein